MAKTPVFMPKFGMTMTAAEIMDWYVERGQEIQKGDPLLSIETEKASVDIDAPEDGYAGSLLFGKGSSVAVGTVLLYTYDTMEEMEREDGTPSARTAPPPPQTASVPAIPGQAAMSKARKVIAENMRASLQNSAQLTHFRTECVDSLVAYKAGLTGISYNDLLIKAFALAVTRYEKARNQVVGGAMITKTAVDVGMAVALEDGLLVPVIRGADKLSLAQIAGERKRLAQSARDGKLLPGEMGDAVGTVSNLGLQNIDSFTPILNSPESMILGVGRFAQRPWIVNGAVVPATVTTLSLTFDHQALDGKDAADFLEILVEYLQNPAKLSEQ